MENINTIIWDWNGTLLDDAVAGWTILNYMQREKCLPETDFNEYKKIFTFPITKYYQSAGFKNNDFFELANLFIERYKIEVENCSLHANTENC